MENIYKAVMRSEKTGREFFVAVEDLESVKHVRLEREAYSDWSAPDRKTVEVWFKQAMWDREISGTQDLRNQDAYDWRYFISFNGNLTLETIPDTPEPAQEEQGHTFKETALASIELLCNSGMKITNVTTSVMDEEWGKITILFKKEK